MSALTRDDNSTAIQNAAVAGYVAAASGAAAPAANTTGGADYTYTWASKVNHILIQNNTAANINWDLDIATTAGSPILASGQSLFLDVIGTTTLHLLSAANQNVNGSTAGNIVVKGWL